MDHYDEDNYEFFDKYTKQNEIGDMTFLVDGISGEYFVVGEVILCTEEHDGFGLCEFPIIETIEFKESAERVKEFINMNFMIDKKIYPKIIVLTHWT